MDREKVIRMAKEAGFHTKLFNSIDGYEVACASDVYILTDEVIRFAALVAAAERERCAKVCDERDEYCAENVSNESGVGCLLCAAAIRALP